MSRITTPAVDTDNESGYSTSNDKNERYKIHLLPRTMAKSADEYAD